MKDKTVQAILLVSLFITLGIGIAIYIVTDKFNIKLVNSSRTTTTGIATTRINNETTATTTNTPGVSTTITVNITTTNKIVTKTTAISTSKVTTKMTTRTTNKLKVPTTTKSGTTPTQKVVIDVKTETNTETSAKYGVKITKNVTYKVTNYNYGNPKREVIGIAYSYDKSSFNATTSQMKSEAQTAASNNKNLYVEVRDYVNKYRLAAGSSSISLNDNLSVAATIRAIELAYSSNTIYDISHTRPNGSSCFTILKECNISYSTAAENIAAGQNTVSGVVNSWYNSSGHRANMQNPSFTKMGVGMYELGGVKYWVQLFAG